MVSKVLIFHGKTGNFDPKTSHFRGSSRAAASWGHGDLDCFFNIYPFIHI